MPDADVGLVNVLRPPLSATSRLVSLRPTCRRFGSVMSTPPPEGLSENQQKDRQEFLKRLEEAGVSDPLQLTPEQRAAAERSKRRGADIKLPTYEETVTAAVANVGSDWTRRLNLAEEARKLRDCGGDQLMALSTAAPLLRAQRQQLVLENESSYWAPRMQAGGYFMASASTAMLALTSVVAMRFTVIAGAIVPMLAFTSWSAYGAFEDVMEDIRFADATRELRETKRSRMPEPQYGVKLTDEEKAYARSRLEPHPDSPLAKKRAAKQDESEEHCDEDEGIAGPKIVVDKWRKQEEAKKRRAEERFAETREKARALYDLPEDEEFG